MKQNYQFVHHVSEAEAKYAVDPRRLDTEAKQSKKKAKQNKVKQSKTK